MGKYTKEFLDRLQKELNTAVLCDILDELGLPQPGDERPDQAAR